MEENSAHWLAIREAARRLLVETDLAIAVPPSSIKVWHRLILNMGDSMPQRLNFPELIEGQFSVRKEDTPLFDLSLDEPREKTTLWLPYDTDELMHDLLQMCSELLLAGYPGCSGCGYRDEEQKWDEIAHRQRVSNLTE
tara:strand:- start:2261 stop:2677 length:417 start_codon:yes stop_codon:yes gene_type:complete